MKRMSVGEETSRSRGRSGGSRSPNKKSPAASRNKSGKKSPASAKRSNSRGATPKRGAAAASSSSSSSKAAATSVRVATRASSSKKTASAASSSGTSSRAGRERNKTPSGTSNNSTALARKRTMARQLASKVPEKGAAELQPVLDAEDVDDDDDDFLDQHEDDTEHSVSVTRPPNLRGDYGNIAILLALYTLQGIPMGFASTIPLLLKEKGVSYTAIGVFSLAHWPFSMKLLWAPIVDSCYSDSTQLLIGIVLILLSGVFNEWCGGLDVLDPKKALGVINMQGLTASFFLLYFLCATQDIAVDGWALTILREENVGYQSMCNAAGQTLGYALAYVGALSLNHFQVMGFDQFMYLSGVAFLVTTVLVALFKAEKPVAKDEKCDGLVEVYKQLMAMWKLKTIRTLVLILFFWKVPYAGCEAVVMLKLQDRGIPKEHMAYLGGASTVLSVFVPLLLSRWTSGARPFDVCISLYLPRLLMCAVSVAMVHFCPNVTALAQQNADFPVGFYALIIVTAVIGVFISTTMFVAQMSYYAKVSPKDIGGTYMTLLNTFGNMGGMWVTPLAFNLVDVLNIQREDADCLLAKAAAKAGSAAAAAKCKPIVVVDGFYLMTAICAVLGLCGYPLLRSTATKLQNYPKRDWKIAMAAK
eukprot:g13578.t1